MHNSVSRKLRLILILASFLAAHLAPESAHGQTTRDTIATYSGSGQATTEPFRVSGPWKVEWESTAKVFFLNGFEAGDPNSTYPAQIAGPNAPSTGSSYIGRGGRYYFKVVSSGGWSLKVFQETSEESAPSKTQGSREATESAALEATYVPSNPEESDFFGRTVEDVGDYNGDGEADILVGTWGKSADDLDAAGKAFLVSGASETVLRTFTSPNPQEDGFFGSAGAQIGDIDDDGTADFLIGAPYENYGSESEAGVAYLISGRTGKALQTLTSPNPELIGVSGSSVERIGDTNGDGVTDVLIGAHRESANGIETAGRAYTVSSDDGLVLHTLTSPNTEKGGLFGRSVSRVPDIDGDRIPDLLVAAPSEGVSGISEAGRAYLLSGSDGQVIHTLSSPNSEEGGWFGGSIAGVGDVNDDGMEDLLIGAGSESIGKVKDAGRAYLFSGRNGEVLQTLTSPNPETDGSFGATVAEGEDVNGDGIPEFAIGAQRESPGGVRESGRAYLFSGTSGEVVNSFKSPNAEEEGIFGTSVTILKDGGDTTTSYLAVSAENESVRGIKGVGRVYRLKIRSKSD